MAQQARTAPDWKLQDATVDVERLGELFLINREQMIATDKLRNSTREALTAVRKQPEGSKAWLKSSSNCFIRSSSQCAIATLQQEAARLESVMANLRNQQKQLVALLADKGATPHSLEEGMLAAMLRLKG